jgi:trans-2,3-dihydro-3-hydroxyanthranilate isomerase
MRAERALQQKLPFTIVDVFAESPRAGNQLAVVENAQALTQAQMQSIAREFNFSETTFVCDDDKARARVRIFTPGEELPFAGHPTLGTAWVLCAGRGSITLALDAGDVPVEFADGIAWMVPPPAQFADTLTPLDAAAAAGVTPHELDSGFEPVRARCGPLFRLIAVRSLDVLARTAMPTPTDKSTDDAVFVYCRGGRGDAADFAARMFFFDGAAVREDPATGSANSAFAAYLQRLGYSGSFTVEQGVEMGRASRIYARIDAGLKIGGRVQAFARGTLVT